MFKLKGFLSSGFRARLSSNIAPTIPVLCPTRKFVLGMASPESSSFKEEGNEILPDKVKIIFLLGGPGSGKGTQSALIVKNYGFVHLSAGDLLQAEVESGSENGKMINEFKKEGKIVPSDITVRLLQQAMQRSENNRFLIDGFPRNEENRAAFERIVKIEPDLVLFFDCSKEELTRRILNRNQGRVDDNLETIPKRLKVYFESTLPVIDYYSSKGKVQKIDGERPLEEVYKEVKSALIKNGSQECSLQMCNGRDQLMRAAR